MNRVVNATVISNFAAVSRLDILQTTVGPLYLPIEVYNELLAGRLAGYGFYDDIEEHIAPFSTDGWLNLISMSHDELKLAVTLPDHLHTGEKACLSIARLRGWGLLTDDRSARLQASAWNIMLSGTLGVLLLAIGNATLLVSEANVILADMIERGKYRTPVTDLENLLR